MSRKNRPARLLPRLRALIGAGVDAVLFLLLAPVVLILASSGRQEARLPQHSLPQTPLEGGRHRP